MCSIATGLRLDPVFVDVDRLESTTWYAFGVAREPGQFIDKHPLAVLEARLDQLPALVHAVEWTGDDATGIDW